MPLSEARLPYALEIPYIPHGIYCKYPMGYFDRKDKMTHTIADKQKLLNRVRPAWPSRCHGACAGVRCRLHRSHAAPDSGQGAINSIMAEVVEDHILMHMIDEDRKPSRSEAEAADELIDVLRTYIR